MSLTDLLQNYFIELKMQASTKQDAITELSSLLQSKGALNNEKAFKESVFAREAECTTGIGMGVAIPHGKSAGVNQACICFGRSLRGINYESLDNQPVHLVFLIAVPAYVNDDHLKMLSQVSRKIIHQDVREQLLVAENFDDICVALS